MIERGHPLSADSGRSSSEIPERLQEFREILVDDEVPERRDSHASSSHEVSLEPTTKRRRPTARCKPEATVYAKESELLVTVMLLEETPAVISLEKLCEDHGYTYHWTSGQKNHISPERSRELIAVYIELCAIRSSWFISEFFLELAYFNTHDTF